MKPRAAHPRDFGRLSHEVSGFTSAFQLRALYDCCRRQTRRGDVLEIGSWYGRSTIALAWALRDRALGEVLYAVDPFSDPGGAPYEIGMRPEGSTEQGFLDNIERWGVSDLIRVVARPSRLAAQSFMPKVRFAFIDGDHRYEEAKHDMEWALKLGATVLFLDDFHTKGGADHPWGAKRAAEEVLSACGGALVAGHDLATENPRHEHSLVSFDLDGSCHGKEVAEAAMARDRLTREHFGGFGRLNF